MAKKKTRIQKKRKLHPLLTTLFGFFAVVVFGVLLVGHAYKNVSPLEEVAGASDTTISVTPPPACTITLTIRGLQPCSKDTYKSISVTCGDSSQPNITSNGQCQSLTSLFVKVAQACKTHTSCKTPTTKNSSSLSPRPPHNDSFHENTISPAPHTSAQK